MVRLRGAFDSLTETSSMLVSTLSMFYLSPAFLSLCALTRPAGSLRVPDGSLLIADAADSLTSSWVSESPAEGACLDLSWPSARLLATRDFKYEGRALYLLVPFGGRWLWMLT